MPRRAVVISLLLIILVGSGLRLASFSSRPLWVDEGYTYYDSSRDIRTLLSWEHSQEHAPLSFLLVKASLSSFGIHEWSLRLPAFIFGFACIPLVFFLGRSLHGEVLGLVAAALVAVDPMLVYQSQNARMYSLVTFLWIATLICVHSLLSRPAAWKWALIAVGLCLAAWTSHCAWPCWMAVVLGLLIARVVKTIDWSWTSVARGFLVFGGTAVLAMAPGLARVASLIFHGARKESTVVPPLLDGLVMTADALTRLFSSVPVAVCMIFGAYWGLARLTKRSRVLAMILAVIVPTSYLVMALIVIRQHPIMPRYMVPILPTIWFGVAALCTVPSARWKRLLGWVLVMLLMATSLGQYSRLMDDDHYRKYHIGYAARYVAGQAGDTDSVFSLPLWSCQVVSFNGLERVERIFSSGVEPGSLEHVGENPFWIVHGPLRESWTDRDLVGLETLARELDSAFDREAYLSLRGRWRDGALVVRGRRGAPMSFVTYPEYSRRNFD